jgi:hypothetical protein
VVGEQHGCAAIDLSIGDDAVECGLVRREHVGLVDVFAEDPFDRAVPAAERRAFYSSFLT